jgi:glycosyl transferase, family 25
MTSLPIFVLNLDRSAERLAWCRERLEREGLELTRVRGVDGTRLSSEEIGAVYDSALNRRHYFISLTSGEVGAYLGHLAAWRRIIADGVEAALVLEDDFACPGSMSELVQAIRRWPVEYDLLRLYGRPTGPGRSLGPLLPGLMVEHRAVASIGCVAQVVSRRGAEKLLSTMMPITRPVDVEMQFWWRHQIIMHNVVPAPFTTQTELQRRSEVKFGQPRLTRDRIRREALRPAFRSWLGLLSRIHWMRRPR